MLSLYEMTTAWSAMRPLLDEPDCPIEDIGSALETIEGEIEEKAEGYAITIREMESEAAAIKAEEKRLAARRMHLENRVSYLKTHLEESMRATGKTKFKTKLFSFGIQKNPPSLSVADESQVPEKYWKITRSIDRSGLLKAVKDGLTVEGIELKQGESLRIR